MYIHTYMYISHISTYGYGSLGKPVGILFPMISASPHHLVYMNMWHYVIGISTYCIAGNFDEVFNLAIWRFYRKSPNLKSAIFYSDEI